MEENISTYVLSANKTAMNLYNQSKESLMTSDNYDFMVFRFYKNDDILEDIEEWEESVLIDEPTYHLLYSNLCIKFRELIKYLCAQRRGK